MASEMKTHVTLMTAAFLAACSSSPETITTGTSLPQFERFTPARSAYQLIPGDQIEVTVHSAPELSRTVTVGPDGRIQLPLVQPVLVADLTVPQAQQSVMQQLSSALVDPRLDMVVSTYAPQKVFVGGDVGQPGVFDLPGQIDPLQAIIMAGGFTDTSRPTEVILLRRNFEGGIESYSFDIKAGIYNPQLARFGPLQRFDVIYVPKSRIAQQNLFIEQYLLKALPIDFSLVYDLAPRRY